MVSPNCWPPASPRGLRRRAPVAEAPQVELEGLGFDQELFRAVAELQLVEIGLAGDRACRGQLIRGELDRRVRLSVAPTASPRAVPQ